MPPVKGSWMKLLYYNDQFNEPSTAQSILGTPISSRSFASEWDVILGYSPTPKVDYMVVYGNAKPYQGGIDRVSGTANNTYYYDDKHSTMLQFTMLYHL